MTNPIHIPSDAPGIQDTDDPRHGGLKYSLLIDASGGPSADLCQGLFFLGAGDREEVHCHDLIETIHVLKGEGEVRFTDRTLALSPGDTVFIPAGQPHGFEATTPMTLFFTFPTARFADVAYQWEVTG